MGSFTSKASGDFDAEGETTWNEAGAPGVGDTVQINNTHNVRIDAGTGNEACLSIDVQTGGTLTIDSEASGALSLTFDDTADCGFGASAGTLVCVGTAGNVITITGNGTPPTNYWDGDTTMDVTMDYTTCSYMTTFETSGTWDVDNCTFSYSSGKLITIETGSTVTSFTNNTLDNSGHNSFTPKVAHAAYDNIVITNSTGYDVHSWDVTSEFDNSNFDPTNSICNTVGIIFSDNHNDTGSLQVLIMGGNDTVLASELTATVLGVGHTLELYQEVVTGSDPTFSLDGSYSAKAIDIKDTTILEIDAVSYGAGLTLTFDDVVGAGFGASAGTLLCIGNGSFGVSIISASSPPGVYWDFDSAIAVYADYTTFSYFDEGRSWTTIDVDNCTFDHGSSNGVYISGSNIVSFTNNTLDNCESSSLKIHTGSYAAFDNIVITNASTLDIEADNVKIELVNSNFDATNCGCGMTGIIFSDAHGDVANTQALIMADGDTVLSSEIFGTIGTGDTLTLYPETGTISTPAIFNVDAAFAVLDLNVEADTVLDIDGGVTMTIDQGGTVTVKSGGDLNWVGSPGSSIVLVSSTPTMAWNLDLQVGSSYDISYVNVQDSDASGGDDVDATDGTNVDNARNVNWNFGSWLTDWNYRKSHTFIGTTGAGTNYQMKIKTVFDGNALDYVEEFGGFEGEGTNPIIDVGAASAWDESIREIGNVLYESADSGKEYKTWYSGYEGVYNGYDVEIGYAYSTDGISWTKVQCEFDHAEDPYIVKSGSTYYMYYEKKGIGGTQDGVAMAISANGQTWADQGLVLEKEGGQWDNQDVSSPIVWIEGATWYMLYEGRTITGQQGSIGLATSADGSTWNKDGSNPVFEPADTSWGGSSLVPDECLKIGNTYYMFYHGTDGTLSRVAKATSTNLTSWTDGSYNPLGGEDIVRSATPVYWDGANNKYVGHYSPSDSGGIYRGYPDNGGSIDLGGKSKVDFTDIRFTDDDETTVLDYWLEEKTDSEYAVFWVELADNLGSDQTIRIYYGNSSAASIDDGNDTFVFFDDFPGVALDGGKWGSSGDVTVADSVVTWLDDGGGIAKVLSVDTWQYDVALRMKARIQTGLTTSWGFRVDGVPYDGALYDKSTNWRTITQDEGSSTTNTQDDQLTGNAWTIFVVKWAQTEVEFYADTILLDLHTGDLPDEALYIRFVSSRTSGTVRGECDWVVVRNYVDPEPSHSDWGSEESSPDLLRKAIVGHEVVGIDVVGIDVII